MKKITKIIKSVVLTAAMVFTIGSVFYFSSKSLYTKALAYSTTCPDYMSDQECLEYLQEQAAKIQKEKGDIKSSINAENVEQLSLSEQIAYYTSKITETELKIAEKEIDIEKKNVEIRLLGEDILETQTHIDTLTQEITNLEDIIEDRTKESYKLTFISPLEVFLDSHNLETMLRKMKYLVEAKKKDRKLLADMAVSKDQLKEEEKILSEKKAEIQEKRNKVESQMAELAEDRKDLESHKAQQQVLLAESQKREQSYQANLKDLQKLEEVITAKVTQLIMELYNSGQIPANTPVNKGDIIGFQGHTGFSYGSHLHFERAINGVRKNPFSGGYLNGGALYSPVTAGKAHEPLAGGYLTQSFWSGHLAIDAVSYTSGNQIPGDAYHLKKPNCCSYVGACVPAGWYSLKGEGAPVYATKSGKVTAVLTDVCGGKYSIVDHGNGETTLYLHLR